MNRRKLLKMTAVGTTAVSTPFFWVPNTFAQASGEVRDQLIAAQNGTFNATNMNQLLARAGAASGTLNTGATAQTIREADSRMASNFPNGSRSQVFGAEYHSIFFRFDNDISNGCAAWFYEDRLVILMEGPILICLHGCMEDMIRYAIDSGNSSFVARDLTREFCAPVSATEKRFTGTFESVSAGSDVFSAERTDIRISYSRQSASSNYGEGRYVVTDSTNQTVVYEGSRTFRLLA